jgi:hypothetical protein
MHIARQLALATFVLLLSLAPNLAAAEETPLPPAQRTHSRTQSRAESRERAERVAAVAAVGGVLLVGGWAGSWIGAMSEGGPRMCTFGGGYTGLVNSGSCTGGPNEGAVGLSFIPLVGSFMTVGASRIDGGRATLTGLMQVAGVLTLAIGLPMTLTSRSTSTVTVAISPGGLTVGGSF